jgi:hypothetical protein
MRFGKYSRASGGSRPLSLSDRLGRRLSFVLVLAVALAAGSCGAPPPSGPTPPSLPPPPSPNTAPQIQSLTVSVSRVEVDTDVDVTAVVSDAETPVEQLGYEWSASVGSFSGTGRAVKWRLPKDAAQTPMNVTFTLTVTEPYQALEGTTIVTRQHRVPRESDPVRVHDSRAEVSKMVLTFLVDYFGNSSVSPDACVVDFSDTCPGKEEERRDIETNRREFFIFSATASVASISFNGAMTASEVAAPCEFRDRHLSDGREGTSRGTCVLTAIYHDNRWWLCTSRFFGTCGSCIMGTRPMTMREFFLSGLPK